MHLTQAARNVFASCLKTDNGVLGDCVQQRWRAMFLHSPFLKHTMAFLGIAFNTSGVQCFCIFFFLTDDGVLRDCV